MKLSSLTKVCEFQDAPSDKPPRNVGVLVHGGSTKSPTLDRHVLVDIGYFRLSRLLTEVIANYGSIDHELSGRALSYEDRDILPDTWC
jgi:hypothetical protein